ncbi:MAG: hypothetical protein F9K24_17705 [Leptonema illini]|jgi:hypothetical protein|uniref:Uncharacterized protein n=1 Tax=Leptonema illini TaxID=183 RepID=A0A833LVT6_9LEPT|nr:MAG: hypothetical protein F9K24_17705 [Leptonema illini]PKL33526.1 MAG: hypothetical protein CVV45_07200 [Spirochaetae bacterium HGW-Spirochaetae-10]
MIDTFLFKLILTAIAFLPAKDGSYDIRLKVADERPASVMTISRTSGPDEHDPHYYIVTDKASGDAFRIVFVDNGLYRVILDEQTNFEIDMIEYYMDIDYEKKSSVMLLGKDGDHPIRVSLIGKDRHIQAASGHGQTVIIPGK